MKKFAAAVTTACVITLATLPVGVSQPITTTPVTAPVEVVASQEPTAQLVPEVTSEVVLAPADTQVATVPAAQPAVTTPANPIVPATSPALPVPTLRVTPTPALDKPLVQSDKVGYVFQNADAKEVDELTADGSYTVAISVDLDKMAKGEVVYLVTEGMSFDSGDFPESVLVNREGYPIAAVADVSKEAGAPLLRISKLELPIEAEESGYGRVETSISIDVDQDYAANAASQSKSIQPHLGILSENPADEIVMLQPYAATNREMKLTKEAPSVSVPEGAATEVVTEESNPVPEGEDVAAVAGQDSLAAPTDASSLGELTNQMNELGGALGDLANTVESLGSGGNAADGSAPEAPNVAEIQDGLALAETSEQPAATPVSGATPEANPEEAKPVENSQESQEAKPAGVVSRAVSAFKQSVSGLVGAGDNLKPAAPATAPAAPSVQPGGGTPIAEGIKPQDRPVATTSAPSSNVEVNNASLTSQLKPRIGAVALGLVVVASVFFVLGSTYLSRPRGRHS